MQSLLSDLMFFVLLSNRGFMAAKVAGHQRNFGATPSLPARIGC